MADSISLTAAPAEERLAQIRAEIAQILEEQRKLCHNINNPLTAIMGRAQILQLRPDGDPQVQKVAQVIEESAKRVAGLVRDLSALIHRGRDVLADGER